MDLYNCLHFSTAAIITGQLKSALETMAFLLKTIE